MSESSWPIVLIEGVMVLGGALAFGWWQLRDLKREQAKAAARRAEEQAAAAARDRAVNADAEPPPGGASARADSPAEPGSR